MKIKHSLMIIVALAVLMVSSVAMAQSLWYGMLYAPTSWYVDGDIVQHAPSFYAPNNFFNYNIIMQMGMM